MNRHAARLAALLTMGLLCLLPLDLRAAEKPKTTLYFLTHSGACPCQAEACQAAKPIAAFVRAHLAAGVEYKELDYGVRPETVEPLLRDYKIFAFPTFLAVDAGKAELFKTQGRQRRDEVLKKLFEQGLITGVN